ncbi:unnamed protein product [Spirodela intermedia]|uniref:Uncharacterized protein n=2 Tax=Spirodela intermedia TaxID=51605 RepID=A0A7I8K8I1_SPIIN|nr:unnamed protein product [Spirodela intermedia]CAA6657913.1 unnamed protein product [Spirodela intermedia]CAA7394041.1 unnamed protein product [Spirodela intermedia]
MRCCSCLRESTSPASTRALNCRETSSEADLTSRSSAPSISLSPIPLSPYEKR